MELTSCIKCEFVDEVQDVESKFMDPYYANELLEASKKLKTKELSEGLAKILETLTSNDCKIRIDHREQKMCQKCKIPMKVEQRWLLEVPEIYTLGI